MGRSDDVARYKLRTSASSTPTPARPGVAGRVGVTLFFLVWLAIPSAILVFMVRDTWKDWKTWQWRQTPCTVVRSGVGEPTSDREYAFQVEYVYAAGSAGELEPARLTSTVYALKYKGAKDYADAQRLALRYPAGAQATCYVNPDNPRDAVLQRNGLAKGAMVLLPVFFIVIGAGGLWFTWRDRRPGWGSGSISGAAAASTGPISKRPSMSSEWGLVLFFCLFGGCGLVVLIAMGAGTLKAIGARSWRAVPATVESSAVRTHRGDESTTYSVDILYRYTIDGRTYKSNRYSFMGGSSSGYDRKREIVSRLRPGTPVTVYVNPADPTDAVLVRGFTWEMLFLGIPLLFVAIGVGGGVYAARRTMRLRREDPFAGVSPDAAGPGTGGTSRYVEPTRNPTTRAYSPRRSPREGAGPVALKARHSPGLRFLGVCIAAVFWNGIVSVFLYHVVNGWARGRGEVCLSIFLVPFVLVGLGLFVGVAHAFLSLFNPRVVLVLGRDTLPLGEAAALRWSLTGRADRVHRLVLRLEGREEATYRQGTDTRTDKNTFFSTDFVDTDDVVEIREGKATVPVPADTMHSFSAANNKVVWVLTVHGHIRGWPDVKDEYLLNVAPRAKPAMPPQETDHGPPGDRPQEATWNA